jgi:hypothetical protein
VFLSGDAGMIFLSSGAVFLSHCGEILRILLFRDKRWVRAHSVRKLFTGLASAARMAW